MAIRFPTCRCFAISMQQLLLMPTAAWKRSRLLASGEMILPRLITWDGFSLSQLLKGLKAESTVRFRSIDLDSMPALLSCSRYNKFVSSAAGRVKLGDQCDEPDDRISRIEGDEVS